MKKLISAAVVAIVLFFGAGIGIGTILAGTNKVQAETNTVVAPATSEEVETTTPVVEETTEAATEAAEEIPAAEGYVYDDSYAYSYDGTSTDEFYAQQAEAPAERPQTDADIDASVPAENTPEPESVEYQEISWEDLLG